MQLGAPTEPDIDLVGHRVGDSQHRPAIGAEAKKFAGAETRRTGQSLVVSA